MWKTVKLGDVCDFQGGSQPPKKEFVFEPQEGYVRFLQIRDFKSDKNVTYIPISNKNRLCNTDDILIGRYGASVGQILRGLEGAYNVALMKTIPNEEVISKGWLYAYLNSPLFQKPLMEVSSRSAQNGFSKDEISAFEFPLPPLAEQQRIVAKLDAAFAEIDRAIEFATTRLDEGRDITSAYLEKHFERELDGDAVSQMSEGLEKITYGFTNPMPTSESGKYLITAKNVINGSIDYDNARFTTLEAFDNELTDKSKPKVGDVLLTKDGTLGRLAVVDRDDICVNQSVAVLRTNTDLNPYYLKWQLFSPLFQRKMQKEAGGTTIKHIYITRVDKMDISIPQLEEQLYLVEKTERLDAKVRELLEIRVRQLANLQALKSAILAQELEPPQSEAA